MKLLVFSDSHRSIGPMEEAVTRNPDAAMLIHLGDHVRDAELLSVQFPGLPTRTVPGNNDFRPELTAEAVIEVQGHRIFLSHGHLYRVKYTLDPLLSAASARHCDIALFGHTHAPLCDLRGGIRLLNPGCCCGPSPSYGILELDGDGIRLKTLFL